MKILNNDQTIKDTETPQGSERRRMPRLNLSAEQFRLSQNGKIFSVVDLSTHGMALRVLDRNDLGLFPIGMHLQGILNFRREKYAIKARVRHLGVDLIGCEFEAADKEVQSVLAILARYLDPAVLGAELKPIPSGDGATWYHGPSGTDLLLWRGTDGQYRRLAVYVLGSYVQWEKDEGLSTGIVKSSFEASEVRGVVRFETML